MPLLAPAHRLPKPGRHDSRHVTERAQVYHSVTSAPCGGKSETAGVGVAVGDESGQLHVAADKEA